MKPLYVLMSLLLLLNVALAGCQVGDDNGADPGENDQDLDGDGEQEDREGTWLEDLLVCRGFYPPDWEEPVRCENELDEVESAPGPPGPEWVCVAEESNESVHRFARLYWNVSDDGYSLFYNSTATAKDVRDTLSGIVAIQREEGTDYRVWNHGHDNATVMLDDVQPGDNLSVWVFVTYHATETPELFAGTWHVNWSMEDEMPFPMRIFSTPHGDYHFHHMPPRIREGAFPWQWEVMLELEGEDFMIQVRYARLVLVDLVVPQEPVASC